jgi:hypothetical protein
MADTPHRHRRRVAFPRDGAGGRSRRGVPSGESGASTSGKPQQPQCVVAGSPEPPTTPTAATATATANCQYSRTAGPISNIRYPDNGQRTAGRSLYFLDRMMRPRAGRWKPVVRVSSGWRCWSGTQALASAGTRRGRKSAAHPPPGAAAPRGRSYIGVGAPEPGPWGQSPARGVGSPCMPHQKVLRCRVPGGVKWECATAGVTSGLGLRCGAVPHLLVTSSLCGSATLFHTACPDGGCSRSSSCPR